MKTERVMQGMADLFVMTANVCTHKTQGILLQAKVYKSRCFTFFHFSSSVKCLLNLF
jgi:hypothetical protein